MKTSVIDVHGMLSVLSVEEVEKRIGEVPGVASVTVNFAAGSATARYDETRLEVSDIKSAVRQRGVESAFPLAAGVLYPFVLSPEIAALSMSGSSAVVAINALLLQRTKLAGIRSAPPKSQQPAKALAPSGLPT